MRHQQYHDKKDSNHELDCNERYFVYLFRSLITVKCGNLYRQLTNVALDGKIIKVTLEIMIKELHPRNNIFLTIICTSGHCRFLEDVTLTFIEHNYPCDSLQKER